MNFEPSASEVSLSVPKTQLLLSKLRISPWMIWGLGAAFFFAEYFARVAPSVMVSDLMAAFQVNALALGSFSAFFYYAYVSMQVPVGMLVDRFGPHRLLTFMALVCAFGSFLFATANNIFMADLGRLLTGFGAAFAFVGSLKLASVWFPATRFGLLAGLTQALGMLGAAVGEAPMSLTVSAIGWRNTMFVITIIFVLLSVFIGLIVRDYPKDYPQVHKSQSGVVQGLWASLRIVLANRHSWINAAYVGMVYAPTAAFAELWGVSFLQRAYGLSVHEAATAVGCIFIGWGVGGPLLGWVSDRVLRRKPIMVASALLGFVLMSSVIYLHLPTYLVFVLLFLYGVSNTGVATSYAVASEINPHAVAGTSMAFANMASVLVGAAFQPLIGWLLVLNWDKVMQNGIPVYSAENFRTALILLPVCSLLSFIVALFVRETYCRPIGDNK